MRDAQPPAEGPGRPSGRYGLAAGSAEPDSWAQVLAFSTGTVRQDYYQASMLLASSTSAQRWHATARDKAACPPTDMPARPARPPAPQGPLAHHAFEATAAAWPGATFLSSEEGSMTYGEVNAAANALAHVLAEAHGVGRDVAVGILAERSFGAVVAMLAVLKVGGLAHSLAGCRAPIC